MQIRYNDNRVNKMLFTELVIASTLSEGKNNVFDQEIRRRLDFCNFEKRMINLLIQYELEILKVTKKEYNDYFYNKKWWLSLQEGEKLLKLPLENYPMYCNGEMSKYALTNSELVSIYDEAGFILNCDDGIFDCFKDECLLFYSSNSITSLKSEFIHRIQYIYKRELDMEYTEEIYNKCMKFFINESHLLFVNKYGYADDDNLKWEPYTDEYYNFFSF